MSIQGAARLSNNKEKRICTYKSVRWILALAVMLMPFQLPPAIHASSKILPVDPACDPEISLQSPGVFCVSPAVRITPGDSNATIARKAYLAQKAKAAALAKARVAQTSAARTSNTGNITITGTSPQCIPYAREVSGKPVYGAARNVPVNSNQPQIGAVVLTKESRTGHAAVVIGIENGELVLQEANYIARKATRGRRLRIDSSVIRGYFI